MVAIAATVVVLLLIVGTVTHAHAKRATQRRTEALKGDWAALEGCLLGVPLRDGESPSSRYRAVQLTVLGTPHASRATAHEGPWPVRCASFADGVADHAEAAGPEAAVDVRTASRELAKDLREDSSATADVGKLVDQTWKAAVGAKIATNGKESQPANPTSAPKPTVPILHAGDLAASGSFGGDFDLNTVKVDPAPSANLRFLVDDRRLKQGAQVCAVSGLPASISCERAPSDVATRSPGLAMLGTTDVNAFPWLFAGDRGELGIYGPSGQLALRGDVAWGASVGADDAAWLLVHQHNAATNDLALIHAPRTGEVSPARRALEGNELASPADATLAWSWLVDWTGPHATHPHHLMARLLNPNGNLGAPVDIGNVPNGEAAGATDTTPRFSTCRSGEHIALRLHAAQADSLTFYTGVAWTAPIALPARAGSMVCEANEVVVTGIAHPDNDPVVEQWRCNAGGCRQAQVASRDLLGDTDVAPRGPGAFVAAELDDQLLMVWNAGPLGGLRMRLAPMDRLRATGDIVIADVLASKRDEAVTSLKVLAADKQALLFVKTVAGVHLFGVDATGKLAPLQAQM